MSEQLANTIKQLGRAHGFDDVRITAPHIDDATQQALKDWLAKQYHGSMAYMKDQMALRLNPKGLLPEVESIICVRLNYHPPKAPDSTLRNNPEIGNIARYAFGRDYHKVLKGKLKALARALEQHFEHRYRFFCDSAPLMERALAQSAGLGWIGKNTMLIHPKTGSWFFLAELLTTLKLPFDPPFTLNHCGSCHSCLDVCPTKAIVAPYQIDARRCISYLTIENKGAIPIEFREAMGNKIFGCDDCQLCCPWNRFAKPHNEPDFKVRHQFDNSQLLDLFLWDEQTFKDKTAGSAIRRTGYMGWLRNIAVALGNAPSSQAIIDGLKKQHASCDNAMVQEHIKWALDRQTQNH